jgi:hypothetical protein
MTLQEIEKRVIERVDEKELVSLATELGNTTAPSGYEQPMADYVEEWLKTHGFDCCQQNLCEGRSNTIGFLRGKGGGKTSSSIAIWIPIWGSLRFRVDRSRPDPRFASKEDESSAKPCKTTAVRWPRL